MPQAIPLIAGVGSALISADSADSAVDAQTQQSERGIQFLEDQAEVSRQELTPFVRGETTEQQFQRDLIGLNGPEAQQIAQATLETPATRALETEGFRSLDQRASTVGGLGGSNRLRELQRFSQNLDAQLQNTAFNQAGALTSQRLGAAGALTGAGAQAASGQAQIAQGIGQAQGLGALQRGQAFSSGLEGIGSVLFEGATSDQAGKGSPFGNIFRIGG